MGQDKHKPGRLFIVGTPLGNLEDITLRALHTLKEVDLIAAEDTRVSRKLLSHYDLHTPTISFHEHSPQAQLEHIRSELLGGKDIALISDAGMPGISDPGEKLIAACLDSGIQVIPIPGPSAVITGLAVSGLPTESFLFIGFIPRHTSSRKKLLTDLTKQSHTLVFYESPHRLLDTLVEFQKAFGNRRAAAARELTKVFEEVVRGTLEDIMTHFTQNPPRGEFTLIIEGALVEPRQIPDEGTVTPVALAAAQTLIRHGVPMKEAAREIAEAVGVSRRILYNALLKLQGDE